MGEYEWMSYREVEAKVANVAAGLLDLAGGEEYKVVIFAETRAHWLITALACFRANLPIVTVYATLGEDAIAHAINETGSSILVTSAELLGKIGTLGKRCHSLRTLIYFPPVNKEAPSPDLTSFRWTNLSTFWHTTKLKQESPLLSVECALLNCPIIDNVCVYGCSLETNTIALVVPNQKHLEKIAEEVGETSRDLKTMCSNEKITAEFLKRMNEHAKKSKLSKVEMPIAIHLCEEVWTPDSGLLTEALKLKRKPLQVKYQPIIDALYDSIRTAS
ncbi:hypothetical protein ANCCEY_08424 [Ancylostoma ceylanicum]|uniref:long-chain-fatty-acid--CoA ligase n=1 Tax=Ancylostoma ceylanicum TaxID=53326 RepID=A0A0D6LMR1_9BILA|nr:hypothetical protein ANCCEY_08424 [Ancylostoma ceylanicum]